MKPLLGKTAIVSGGSRGIGLAIAQRFAKNGASCVLLARDTSRLQGAILQLDDGDHQFHAIDVSRAQEWIDLRGKVKDVDILVNAAGITHYSLAMNMDAASVDTILKTNLHGTIYGCQAYAKALLRSKGNVLNVSSVFGLVGGKGSSVYAASKAGVIGFTTAFAEEMGSKGVRVNAICPGYIDTDMTKDIADDARAALERKAMLRRFGTAEEVADAALYLAMNSYSTATILNIDGGYARSKG